MNEQLPLAIRQANEILDKANLLSEKLKDMAYASSQQGVSGVDPLIFALTIFILACFVGYYVVWKPRLSLH